jgi:16S rRNA (adenine(1408)-N(1))-methyltransferase
VVVDLGTGDGRFVLAAAREDPRALVIGIDADASSMVECSRRAVRRDALPNALFVVAAAEALPPELHVAAARVTVHFPWGSLLRGLVTGEPDVAGQIASTATADARIELLLSARPSDHLPWLPRVDGETASRVGAAFAARGFRVRTAGRATPEDVVAAQSTWAKRLGNGREAWSIRLERAASQDRLATRTDLGETGRP